MLEELKKLRSEVRTLRGSVDALTQKSDQSSLELKSLNEKMDKILERKY